MKNYSVKIKSILMLGVFASIFSCSNDERLDQLESVSSSAQLNSVIQAEDYDVQNGVEVVNGSRVGFINDGDWIRFDDFEYDGANSISVQAGTRTGGGTIEIRTGSPTGGDLLGTLEITNTGNFNNFETFTASIDDDSSNSDLFLTFRGGNGFLFDIDSFTFNTGSAPSTGGGNNNDDNDSANIALNGVATQSSNAFNAPASRAIDGDTNGRFGGNSVTHTTNTNQPWWQVRFDGNQAIGDIVIWNRTDNCCINRLSNFNVSVLNASGNIVFNRTINDAPNPSLTINTGGVSGNVVSISLNETGPLSLAEVQVFSTDGDVSTTPIDAPTEEIETGDFGLNPNLEPWENFDLSVWSLDSPAPRPSDECRATRIDEDEWDDVPGSPTRPYFFTHTDGGMRFVSPVGGATTNSSCNSGFPRSELREMLRAGNTSISTTGVNGNNWALGYQDPNPDHGGRNGVLSATLVVNRVTTTGSGLHPGRTIIGQIHASDDEPARLYYRKCPDAEFGSVYLEHEIRDFNGVEAGDVTFNLLGSELCSGNGPSNGIRLGELFSYDIINEGSDVIVNIYKGDKEELLATTTVDMLTVERNGVVGSGYDRPELDDGEEQGDEWMYFKAGAYTQNNTGDPEDTDVITFYRLSNTHDAN